MRIHLQGIFNHESDSYGFHEAGWSLWASVDLSDDWLIFCDPYSVAATNSDISFEISSQASTWNYKLRGKTIIISTCHLTIVELRTLTWLNIAAR
jgi:hypothetical protein